MTVVRHMTSLAAYVTETYSKVQYCVLSLQKEY
jgi:hypothetical protein